MGEEGSIAPVLSSPVRVLGDHTLGACFIDPYQNGPADHCTQGPPLRRSCAYTDPGLTHEAVCN